MPVDDLLKLNGHLKENVFLDGEISPGKKDKEMFKMLKGSGLQREIYPDIDRWLRFMEKLMKG